MQQEAFEFCWQKLTLWNASSSSNFSDKVRLLCQTIRKNYIFDIKDVFKSLFWARNSIIRSKLWSPQNLSISLKALPTFRCIFSSREQIKIECFCLCFMSANGAMEREANINTGWRYDDSPRWYFLCFKWPKWITLLEGDVDPLSVKAISCCVHVLQKLWWSRL